MVDAFRFLIIEEGRGLYSGFLFFFFSFFFSFFLLLRCFESMVRILLGLFRLGFMSCHSSSYQCSQNYPFELISGSLPGIGEAAPRNHHLCYDMIHTIAYPCCATMLSYHTRTQAKRATVHKKKAGRSPKGNFFISGDIRE